jgi:hypothetical protein
MDIMPLISLTLRIPMPYSSHDFFPFIRDCRLSLLNHHFVQHLTQIVIPDIHMRHVPGEKPVDQGCAFICIFLGQHHHNFPVLKKVFVSVKVFERLSAVDPKDHDGGFRSFFKTISNNGPHA